MGNNKKTALYVRLARPMNVALYCRVAHADTEALAFQERTLLHFAESTGYESGKYNEHHIYRDNGKSGATLDRPAMNKLMSDIRDGRVDAVIVKDISHISRNHSQINEWLRLLRQHDVRLVSVTEGIIK